MEYDDKKINNNLKEEENNSKKNDKKSKILLFIIAILVVILLIILGLRILIFANYKNCEENSYNYTSTQTTNGRGMVYKPVIYLNPTEDTNVLVKLKYKNNIVVSYPEYLEGWNVLAKTDGNLVDLMTNKKLYALYYESENIVNFNIEKDGFVISKENLITFLEEKLTILGLTDREAEEFIIYWLPILQKNKYNYIRFASTDEINKNMPIEINPNPDTIIRVLMTFKGLEEPMEVEEQKLITPNRNGFVAVEWGGTEIK